MEFDLHNHRGNNFIRSSSLNMPHNYSSGDTMIASPLSHHWNPQPLRSSNVPSNSNNNGQRKRDFHFQVIQVQNQGPKWLFFPSQQTLETNIKKNNSDQENEHLRIGNTNEQGPSNINSSTNFNNNNISNISSASYRKQQFQQLHNLEQQNERYSEPIQRRILNKPIIQIEPSSSIPINTPSSNCSNSSTTSSTFKILHVTKKQFDNDSDDDDDYECSCRKLSLSLDDDCPLPRQHHYSSYSSSRSSNCSASSTSTM